ncbi:MAG: DUF3667 domain-containing protein [Hyphomonas sp.]|uniref:DUF3667 domain-containing protein n=1 Tax=Hyphomonas sp. TaxID=87 RepID=UPI003528C0F3
MGEELEVIGAASIGAVVSGEHHPVEPGKPCGNCGAIVSERYCPRCGQLGSDFHRPFFSLIASSIADTFALDSRLWRSLPLLLFRPGRLTRNYIEGKRARYVPPFRLFLLSSVLFFLAVFGIGDQMGWYADWKLASNGRGNAFLSGPDASAPTQTQEEALQTVRDKLAGADLPEEERTRLEAELKSLETNQVTLSDLVASDGHVDRDALKAMVDETTSADATEAEKAQAMAAAEKAARVFENQDKFGARFREWAPRFSLLFMPIFALMLTMAFAWHRRLYVYDHVIGALHFQTFLYLLLTALILAGAFTSVGPGTLTAVGFGAVSLYLVRFLRVAYGSGWIMSVLRVGFLMFGSLSVLILLGTLLVVISFLLT